MTNSNTSSPAPAWERQAQLVAAQDWPAGALFVVATPIGNLGDLTLRAWHALQLADVIAAEDTRTTRPLLDAWGVGTPLIAAHQHNEAQAAQDIISRLGRGERVALVSDAGAPAVSDPGARIVREVAAAGHRVIPLPGPSAVIAALMASGATSDENPGFAFAGFPPHKAGARKTWLREWSKLPVPVVMFESPHRLVACLRDIHDIAGDTRRITIGRELTKRFEEIVTLPLTEAAGWLGQHAHRLQGEFVLILEAAAEPDRAMDAATDVVLQALLEIASVRDAAKAAAKITGHPRDTLYARALALREQ